MIKNKVRSHSWKQDQKSFESGLRLVHKDSEGFFTSVRNSVAKQSRWKSRPRQISKDMYGKVLGFTSASVESREFAARVDANRALLECDQTLKIKDFHLSWCDESIRNWAQVKASNCIHINDQLPEDFAVATMKAYVEQYGFVFPEYDLFGASAAVARCCDEKWWRRQARVAKVRAMDQLARSFRMVHAKAQAYASDEAVSLRREQVKRNRGIMEGFEAINQEGEAYTLAELSDLSVSNPKNRRHELMVRIRGFEEIADRFGHVGLFITLSAPSRFHPMRQVFNKNKKFIYVTENKNYEGLTPRDAQAWLTKTWSLIRAKLARDEIKTYGFRVVEPHSDGCPHWHKLLFFRKEEIGEVRKIFKKYALRTDFLEKGAAKYRLKIVEIDKSRGTAAGYIAKYICKNIDGSHLDEDWFGHAGATAAERICAWASAWGIRQFQQIGGGTVTVWRELRRMDVAEGVVELARLAADSSDWAAYCLVQGYDSAFVGRDAAPIRPARWFEHHSETGEVIDEVTNKYGDESQGKLFGVRDMLTGRYWLSRFYRWTIQRIGAVVATVKKCLPSSMSDEDLLDFLRGDGLGFSTA